MTQLVRRYDIGGLIAEGGMAEIVAASAMTEAGVSKRVALKRIRTGSSSDPQFVARFFDEVRLAMQLSHANVVQVFDFGRTEDNAFFLAMEFVEGVDVQRLRRLPDGGRLPPAEALHVVAQMLRGLDYAHRRTDSDNRPLGIVHMDVKPANVLVSFEGEVKLTDFGVARSRDVRRPTVGISGTIPFMSPEQTRGEPVDLRSDVFSAGVLLYALLAGECPFGEEDSGATLYEIQQCRYRPPAGLDQHERFDPLLETGARAAARRSFRQRGRVRRRDRRADVRPGLARRRGRAARSAARRVSARARAVERALRSRQAARGPRRHAGREPARGDGVVARRRRGARRASRPGDRRSRRRRRARAHGAGGVRRRSGSRRWRRPARSCFCARGRAPVVAPVVTANRPPAPAKTITPATTTVTSTAAPPLTPAPAPTPAPKERTAPVAMGTISVNASPWATVRVNGKLAGTTPILRFPVRAGRASVTIENPKLGRKQVDVKIEAKKDTPLIVDLRSGG